MSDQQYQWDAILEHQGHRRVFIETGTALGETTAAMIPFFDKLYTIEYHYNLYRAAEERFWDEPKVHVLQGDSANMIKMVNFNLGPDNDAVYWLDAHYDGGDVDLAPSGTTPVGTEIIDIMRYPNNHAILVDDARLFGNEPGYPSLGWLKRHSAKNSYSYELRDDVIRLIRDV